MIRELDQIDRRLIDELRVDGRESLANLGVSVGLSSDSVKDRLVRLAEDGVVRVTCSVNPKLLGFQSIALLGIKVNGEAEKIAKELVQHPEFDFVCCVAGEYDILVEAVCRDNLHLLNVVDSHLRSRADITSVSTHCYLDVLKFSPPSAGSAASLENDEVSTLDKVDQRIVRALQADGRASFQEISDSIGLPYQTTRRRAKHLLDSKLVRIETLVDRITEGTAIVAGVNIRTNGPISEIARKLLDLSEVEIAVVTSGRFDLLLEVACRDVEHLADLVGNLIPSIPGVASCESSIYQLMLKLPQSWSGLVRSH